MSFLSASILIIHYALISILCVYGLHRFYHAFRRFTVKPTEPADISAVGPDILPMVTVQAPLYNERFVVERLIDSLIALRYPKDRIQIQIIDDSNDESVQIVADRVSHYQDQGYNISQVRRQSRYGYKAGALADAMESVEGEFIAIFDADFLPDPDFLLRTVPLFSDQKVGLVQSRWQHLNGQTSVLTKVQSVMLDAHFGVDQTVRAKTGAFFNFNGTAGIWRKEAIMDAGGWSADTLTEDIDLSYRAQMKGWRFLYLEGLGSPSEIPEDMAAFKTQQHRWAKGAIQVMKKLVVPIWKSSIPIKVKMEATFHLTANISYLVMLIDSTFFLLPAIHVRETLGFSILNWLDIPLFVFASLSHAWFFLAGQKALYGKITDKLLIMPALLATSIGLAVNNGRAVLEAIFNHKSGFVRTPKSGGTNEFSPADGFSEKYAAKSTIWSTYFEIALAVMYLFYMAFAIARGYWLVVPFLVLFANGFAFIGMLSLKEQKAKQAAERRQKSLSTLTKQGSEPFRLTTEPVVTIVSRETA